MKMATLNHEIGNRLKEIRKDLDMHQHQFCKVFNICQSNYCRIEQGLVDITATRIKTLYEKFNVSVEWLIFGTGEKYKEPTSRNQEDNMNIGYPLIEKIKEIPIQFNRRYYIPKYLQAFTKEIAAFSQVDQCGIFLFAKSTLLRDTLVKTYPDLQIELQYGNFRPIPWVTNTNNKQDVINIPDLMKLDRTDPILNYLFDCFGSRIQSVLIIPIYLKQSNKGSIILLTESRTHLFTPGEIEILKQASALLTTSLDQMIKQQAIDETEKILYCISEYKQRLKQDKEKNKNPDIIAELLQKVFDLKSIYIMKKCGSQGNLWYQADINENNEIESKTGTVSDRGFDLMLEETKNNCPDFLDIPLKNNGTIIGKLLIDHWRRENDQLFKKEINKILQGSADALAQLMYS